MISAWLATLGIAAAFILLGALLVRAMLGDPDQLDIAALSLPLGAGVYTWVLFVLGWLGLPIRVWTCLLAFALVLAPSATLAWRNRARPAAPSPVHFPHRPISQILIWGAFALLIVIALGLSFGRSQGDYDAATIWTIKGYGIALEGTLAAGARWGEWSLSYPLNLMLQAATFWLFGAESIPGSKMIFPLYLASVAVGCYAFLRRRGVPARTCGLAMLFLSTNTFIFQRSTTGYANLPFTASLILAATLAIDGIEEGDGRRQLLSGLLFGVASWTRPEAPGYALLVILVILGLFWARRAPGVHALPLILPYAAMAGMWVLFAQPYLQGSQLSEAIVGSLRGIASGVLNLRALVHIPILFLKRAISPDNWGLFVPVVSALLLAGLSRRAAWREPDMAVLVALACLTVLVPIGIYYAITFIPWEDYELTLGRDFDRAFMPAYFMLTTLAVLAASRRWESAEDEELTAETQRALRRD